MQALSSVQYQNRKVIEPGIDLANTVPTPELNDETIYSSNLTFINISEGLHNLIDQKIYDAQMRHIGPMRQKNHEVQAHKSLLRALEKDGLSVIPAIDADDRYDNVEFKSCGDIEEDLRNIEEKTFKAHTQLLELDEKYYPVHMEIKRLQTAKHQLDEFADSYKIKLSQLNRVLQRIGKHIEDNKATKDSTKEAIQATKSQQALMVSKISEKIGEIEARLKHLKDQRSSTLTPELVEEIKVKREYLRGLYDFVSGLTKLRATSECKIEHLDLVITQLIEQRASINQEIRNLKERAVSRLKTIQREYLKPESALKSKEYDHRMHADHGVKDEDDLNRVQLPDFRENAPSSLVTLLHSREKFMKRIYKRVLDLESRALTRSSTAYLHSLTEIRELQTVFRDRRLKYFYNAFVTTANAVFNDCCLAYQALLELTAELNSPIILQLKGMQLLNSVLRSNADARSEAVDSGQNATREELEIVVDFIQSLPDREIVIMQVARYLATSVPFRDVIIGEEIMERAKPHKEGNGRGRGREEKEEESIYGDSERGREAKHMVKIDAFVMVKIREWMGSIITVYGDDAFNSIGVALENDVIAQVRPSMAAKLIVSCVYGLHVSW